jgi:hypothetical protein
VLIRAALTGFTTNSESRAKIEIHIPMTPPTRHVVAFVVLKSINNVKMPQKTCILEATKKGDECLKYGHEWLKHGFKIIK